MKSSLIATALASTLLLAVPALAAGSTSSAPPATTEAPAKPAKPAKPAAHQTRIAALYTKAQEKLKKLGKYDGAVDGTRNAAFVKSLKAFQTDHKLKPTGRLNKDTRKALDI